MRTSASQSIEFKVWILGKHLVVTRIDNLVLNRNTTINGIFIFSLIAAIEKVDENGANPVNITGILAIHGACVLYVNFAQMLIVYLTKHMDVSIRTDKLC